MSTKACSECKIEKPVEAFGRALGTPGDLDDEFAEIERDLSQGAVSVGGTAISSPISVAPVVSDSVIGMRSKISSVTGLPDVKDVPRSPCSTRTSRASTSSRPSTEIMKSTLLPARAAKGSA